MTKIYVLCYGDDFVRFFSSRIKALQFKDICCKNDSSLDPSDYWVLETDVDNFNLED